MGQDKEKIKAYQKAYRLKNADKIKIQAKERYINNKEKYTTRSKEYREKNKEKLKIKAKEWIKNNIEKRRKIGREWARKKSQDPEFRKLNYKRIYECFKKSKTKNLPINILKRRYRSSLSDCIKKNKTLPSKLYLGIDFDLFKKYIESKFKKGMTWDNYGRNGWHIDHVIPLNSAKTKEDLIKLFHYTNLQPLWESENISKSDKIPKVQLKLTL